MGKYLITGNAGTGKSTVIEALRSRGFTAFDGDLLEGIHTFLDKETMQIVEKPGPEGFSRFSTVWRPAPFIDLLKKYPVVFIGGTVYNQNEFYAFFDAIFALKTTPEVLSERLSSRTNNPAGNKKEDRDYLTSINDKVNKNLAQAGAIFIDADQPLEDVIAQILEHCHEG